MREIRFRAWDKKAEKMDFCFNPVSHGEDNFFRLSDALREWGRDVILMQYTGLHDKNGKEIYEGDILLVLDDWTEHILEDGSGPKEESPHLAPVIFKDGAFGCDIKENSDYYKCGFISFPMMEYEMCVFENKELEVIGNIYENTELMPSA